MGLRVEGGGNNNFQSYEQRAAQINAEMERLSSSIPEQTTTAKEKEDAIKVKNEIIKLKRELIELARKHDPDIVPTLEQEVQIITGERDTIKQELARMSNVFDPGNHKPDTSTSSIFGS